MKRLYYGIDCEFVGDIVFYRALDVCPVLEKNVEKGGIVTGTGHNSVTWSKDGKQMYCVYHGRTQKTGDERVVFIDKMRIDENGLLVVEGPTTDPQQSIQ